MLSQMNMRVMGAAAAFCVACLLAGIATRAAAVQTTPRFLRSQLTWFDRGGKKIGVLAGIADYGNVELSPDGARVAAAVVTDVDRGARDIWVIDSATGQHTAAVSRASDENWAIWSRDGRNLVFNSGRNGGLDLYEGAAAGAGSAATPLLIDRDAKWPVSWSGDGRYVLYVISSQRPGNHIFALPLFGDRKPFPFQQSDDTENWAAFSPDGHWVAYSSTASGEAEVYIAAFPPVASGRKWQVSTDGGTQARWRRDGKELYFLSSDKTIMAADITFSSTGVAVGTPQPLFEIRAPYGNYHAFDVTADGQRFLVNTVVVGSGKSVIAH